MTNECGIYPDVGNHEQDLDINNNNVRVRLSS